jgi:subtilisin family serine protease
MSGSQAAGVVERWGGYFSVKELSVNLRTTTFLGLLGLLAVAACAPDSNPLLSPEADVEAQLKSTARNNSTVDVIVILDETFAPGGHAANQAEAGRIARGLGLSPKFTYGTAAYGFSATIPEARLNGLRRNPQVAYVEIDRIASIPRPVAQAPKFCTNPANADHPACAPDGGGEDPPAEGNQTTPWGITRVGGFSNGAGLTAWVIDTGIDFNHADLNVDVGRSANFVQRGKDSAKDGNGHGTHVAGTIAAIHNGIDVVGVAAGATVVAVRVLDNGGSGSYSGVIAGVDYVAVNGIGDVANMSLGGPPSTALDNAVRAAAAAGVKFALAAGNSGDDANSHSPARANGSNIYTVSAINSSDCLASWSNWGNPPVDYAAPGVSILSTKKGGGTTTYSGTSMASPHVAGLLLLGNINTSGTASCASDGTADPIAHN